MRPTCLQRGVAGLLLLLLNMPVIGGVPAPEALREQAQRHETGDGETHSFVRAFDLYCLAALEGDGEAAYGLGNLYLRGLGRVEDEARAAGWFLQAKQAGHPEAGMLIEGDLAQVSPADDSECPLVVAHPDRKAISTWVRLLAPYYSLRPDLVLSVIQVESNFNAQARSPKNAMGLMQLMKPTADRFGVEDIRNPLQNIKGGMAYLSWLQDHYRHVKGRRPGRIRLMLAAYNAGEHAVKKHRGIPPYEETQKYVKRVVSIYAKYIRARKGLARSAGSADVRKKARLRKKQNLHWNRQFRKSYTPISSLK